MTLVEGAGDGSALSLRLVTPRLRPRATPSASDLVLLGRRPRPVYLRPRYRGRQAEVPRSIDQGNEVDRPRYRGLETEVPRPRLRLGLSTSVYIPRPRLRLGLSIYYYS